MTAQILDTLGSSDLLLKVVEATVEAGRVAARLMHGLFHLLDQAEQIRAHRHQRLFGGLDQILGIDGMREFDREAWTVLQSFIDSLPQVGARPTDVGDSVHQPADSGSEPTTVSIPRRQPTDPIGPG